MRIAVAALGTRGDVQPIIALSKGLKAAGHDVTMIAGSNFAGWVESHGLAFTPSADIEALMSSDKGVAWSQSSDSPNKQLRMMRDLLHEHSQTMLDPILESAQSADLIISSFSVQPFVQTVSEKTRVPYLNALLQPQQPTRSGTASFVPVFPASSSPANYWVGALAQRAIWWVAADTTNAFRAQLGLPKHTFTSFNGANRLAPSVLGFSRHVVPMPPDWRADAVISGYWFLDEDETWQPPDDLLAFLNDGPPPVYIGFGSMANRDPALATAMILAALRATGQRAVVASGWGGLAGGDLPDTVFAIRSAPHRWLFDRVSAVVHHGGAGTTAAGLRAGVPALIVPHMADQPFWGRRVHELGVGARPIPRHKLTAVALATALTQLTTDSAMRSAAASIGEKIRAEHGIETAITAIEHAVP